MVQLLRRNLMKVSVAAALGASTVGVSSAEHAQEVPEADTPGAPSVQGDLKRFSTTAFGAEVTGPFVFEDGSMLYSLQHPDQSNPGKFGRAAVGYFSGFNFEFNGRNDDFAEVGVPDTDEKQRQVQSKVGDYKILIQGREPIQNGSETLGVCQTPDGTSLNELGGGYGTSPDCNQFVSTNAEGTEGYLFTNWENYPGCITRVPLSQDDSGMWSADTSSDEALNLPNTEAFRDIGGTRVNCYGDLSPWGTMISSEEDYGQPTVSRTHMPSDLLDADSGEGILGASHFWNRPNPSEATDAINTYAENGDIASSWYPQGGWALGGIELLAYYLGAERPEGENGSNTSPIGDIYPNQYRYGYHVDIRDPAADVPTPVKYHVMGRAAWESPDIQGDRKTVYGCSDGDSKAIYKFVAEEEIDSYDDTDNIEGTLYAPKITNDAASVEDSGERNSPAQTPLEVEWLELGHATNGEVESWIAEYDDVTQVDYITEHTEYSESELGTDVSISDAVKEADLEVIESGNQTYITIEEIVEWAEQYEQNGPNGVDEELRRVPFLETRAAAKEIGASVETNKAEGVDSVDNSQPGDFVYFGISEFNDALADDQGDIQMDRVDGGVVYRAELEPDYNVSTLEPVITGPDFTDSPEDADDALRNIDNVYVMRDGRVLCCEDGFGGPARSYPNDGLYVYQPNVRLEVSSVAVGQGDSVEAEVFAKHVPDGLAGGEFSVSVADTEVVEITSASYPDAVGLSGSPSVSGDGQTASFRFADLQNAMQPEDVNFKLGTVRLTGNGAGVTDLNTEASLDSDAGEAIDVENRSGIAITGPSSVGSADASPTDPDGDGLYEDVNGNGRVDYQDVQLLFDELDSNTVTSNARAFDFNQNDRLDFDDIVTLYGEVN